MRQAGRYMSEYRALRERYSLLELCRTPDLATAVTLQPVRRIEVDAAILFSDLLLPLEPMGVRFDFIKGEGPSIENPLRSEADLARVRRFEPREALAPVLEAIRQITHELRGRVPLIGFAGAPFTLASYAIEGGHSNNFAHTKALMYGAPAAWHRFCDLLSDIAADYLIAQIEAGVQAVQVFDSWVGALNADDYREFILPHSKKIFDRLVGATTCRRFISASARARFSASCARRAGDVIGADWRLPLDEAWTRIGFDRAIQGNLDPTVLLGPLPRMLAADRRSAGSGGRPAGPHLQPRSRHSADDAGRARAGGRAIRASANVQVTACRCVSGHAWIT